MTNLVTKSSILPHISVVIPAYNEEKNIGKCLDALAAQSVKPFEVIVADNNSTDRTAAIAHEYNAKTVLATEQGYVFALRKGMDNAKAEIIAVVDADTVVAPDWIEVITKTFVPPDVVGVTGSIRLKTKGLLSKVNVTWYKYFLVINFVFGTPHLVGFNMAVRKSALDQIGGLDTTYKMGPDVELGLRLRKVGRVLFIDDMFVYPSMRRWKENPLKTFIEYARSYIFTIWLKKPAGVMQKVIR